MSILPKHLMTEEDIKLQFITPAVTAKWNIGKITMETKLTDGKINLRGNFAFREKPKRADYILYLAPNHPIAVIEAKDNNRKKISSFWYNKIKQYQIPLFLIKSESQLKMH